MPYWEFNGGELEEVDNPIEEKEDWETMLRDSGYCPHGYEYGNTITGTYVEVHEEKDSELQYRYILDVSVGSDGSLDSVLIRDFPELIEFMKYIQPIMSMLIANDDFRARELHR